MSISLSSPAGRRIFNQFAAGPFLCRILHYTPAADVELAGYHILLCRRIYIKL